MFTCQEFAYLLPHDVAHNFQNSKYCTKRRGIFHTVRKQITRPVSYNTYRALLMLFYTLLK